MMIKKKGKKKKGFTLIELIAVIAIIGILAAVLVPKVLGYMNDARDTKVIAQARNVVMAFETINAKDASIFAPAQAATVANPTVTEVEAIGTNGNWNNYFTLDISELDGSKKMSDLKAALDKGNKGAAEIRGKGKPSP